MPANGGEGKEKVLVSSTGRKKATPPHPIHHRGGTDSRKLASHLKFSYSFPSSPKNSILLPSLLPLSPFCFPQLFSRSTLRNTMANPRQRRKARSTSTLKPSINAKQRMRKRLARAPTIHGPDILKDSYDPTLTLKQNYAKLGLIPSLNVRPSSGGTEPTPTSSAATASSSSSNSTEKPKKGMARIVRDDDGNIVDIVEAQSDEEEAEASSPWGKPMTSVADDHVETYMPSPSAPTRPAKGGVVQELEIMASKAEPVHRHTSTLESQWLANLITKHGQDTESMARDTKLNVWQKTQGEIKRAINKAGGFQAFQS